MKIALYDNLQYSGGKRQAYEMARSLSARGHVVDLWTTTKADSGFLRWEDVTQRQFCYAWPESPRVPNRLPGVRGYVSAGAVVAHYRRVCGMSRQMAEKIDLEKYDFILLHHCPLVHGPYLLRFLHTPSVYYCNEPMREFYDPVIVRPYQRTKSPMQRLYSRWYAPARLAVDGFRKREDYINVRLATVLVANSRFSAESLYRAYHRESFVSYLGVDTNLFYPLHLPRENFVLSVGEVKPHKGYDFIIRALGRLEAAQRPKLILVGNTVDEDEGKHLRQLAKEHGVQLEVRRMISDSQLAELHNRACTFVYASRLEPFGLAPVEAMACGTPVVAVAEGGARESVQDGVTGLLTQRDPNDFARALSLLLQDRELRGRLGDNGVSQVRAFWTWDAAYTRFMKVIGTGLPNIPSA